MGSESKGTPISGDEAAILAGRVADLATAGLAMPDGLRCLADELPGRRLPKAARDLANRVERGESLADAIEAQGRVLPPHVREMLIASIRSGRMGPILGEFVTYSRIGADLRRGLIIGLLYPILMILGFGGLLTLLYGYLVPQFRQMYAEFNVPIPSVTMATLQAAEFLGAGDWRSVLKVFAGPVILFIAWRLMLDARSRSWTIRRIPLLGAIFRWASLSEFCHYAAVLVAAEVPLDRAVMLAADATGDADLAHSGRRASTAISGGQALGDALGMTPAFPRGVAFFLGWAEGRRALPESLHTLGDLFAAEARGRASLVAAVVAVLTVVFILWAVGFTVVGLFMPLIRLISALSG